MKLFINDKLIHILKSKEFSAEAVYDMELDSLDDMASLKLIGNVLIHEGHPDHIDDLITLMELKKMKKLNSITYVTDYYKEVKDFIKGQFRVIKAAGGLVIKNGKVLMIYRLGKWDLPKGKLEKDEGLPECAVREVEEECCIKAEIDSKIVSTWHTYVSDGRKTLKKTTWYLMHCTDDSNMHPQTEEDIEDLRWMSPQECQTALENSYASIIEVFNSYKLDAGESAFGSIVLPAGTI
ncbi:MAG: NUDIX hydrolase [Bacteroidota bacterium]